MVFIPAEAGNDFKGAACNPEFICFWGPGFRRGDSFKFVSSLEAPHPRFSWKKLYLAGMAHSYPPLHFIDKYCSNWYDLLP